MAEWKKSYIWSFFTLMEDTSFAKCNACANLVCRKTCTTMNLLNHLKIHHKEVFAEFQKQKQVQQEQQNKGIKKPLVKQIHLEGSQ